MGSPQTKENNYTPRPATSTSGQHKITMRKESLQMVSLNSLTSQTPRVNSTAVKSPRMSPTRLATTQTPRGRFQTYYFMF